MAGRDREAPGTPDASKDGLTRREALRRGTLAGLGLVWVTPHVASYKMSAQFAQATSPVPGTTIPGDTTGPTTEVSPTTISSETTVETVDEGPSGQTTQPRARGTSPEEIKDEVLSSELPFTGLPLEQLLPLAGGAIATGAAAVRLARERSESSE